MEIRQGSRVWWPAMRAGGSVEEIDGKRARVALDNGAKHTVTLSSGAIEADPFRRGDQVVRFGGSDETGVIVAPGSSPLYAEWEVAWSGGERTTVTESALRRPVLLDPHCAVAREPTGRAA